MNWKCFKQPAYIWNMDIWERGTDGKVFIANVRLNCWIGKDGEKVTFDRDIIIGRCV